MMLTFCIVVLVTIQLSRGQCPSNYRQIGHRHPKCYSFAERPNSNWTTAIQVCQQRNGVLAMIKSEDEEFDLRDYMPHHFPWDHWLGGHLQAGQWTWQPTGAAVGYTGWGPGEPDNGGPGGEPENCLALTVRSETLNVWWDDRPCHELYGVICEPQE